jgi:hypothetical protein
VRKEDQLSLVRKKIMESLKMGDHIEVLKTAAVEHPVSPTPEFSTYICGQDNGDVSIPCEYSLKGYLDAVPKVGTTLRVNRYERNGVKSLGYFETTFIKRIAENKIYTENSIYIIKKFKV